MSTAPTVLVLSAGGERVGTLRHGTVEGRPVHAAACAVCYAGRFDQPDFDRVKRWILDHLASDHGVSAAKVTVSLPRYRGRPTPIRRGLVAA
jgi:hypothetical protein